MSTPMVDTTTQSPTSDLDATSQIAQDYYDSNNAFNFYKQVWGGEHIHIGLYSNLEGDDVNLEGVERIQVASKLNTSLLLSKCFPSESKGQNLMDLGSGYGGTAREAVRAYGCRATCINVSKRENEVNAAMTAEANLTEAVRIPGEKTFLDTEEPSASYDVVVSQDALLHAGSQRDLAVLEAARVLKPGGFLVFTDIMQSEEAESGDLQEVYNRIHLEDLATPEYYMQAAKKAGLNLIEYLNHTENLIKHYSSVGEVLQAKRGSLIGVQDEFVTKMLKGLDAWVDAGSRDVIRWGYFVFQKEDQ